VFPFYFSFQLYFLHKTPSPFVFAALSIFHFGTSPGGFSTLQPIRVNSQGLFSFQSAADQKRKLHICPQKSPASTVADVPNPPSSSPSLVVSIIQLSHSLLFPFPHCLFVGHWGPFSPLAFWAQLATPHP
jgi:hypothetical protein